MKKFLLIACCSVLISSYSGAQLNPIPNTGFETWYYTQIWTIEADQWYSNNSSIAAWNVVPDSVSHTGLLGLKIQNISYRGNVWAEFPLTQHPVALDCFVKNGLSLGDTAIIRVHIYQTGILVDSGYAEIYGGIGTTYLPFTVNITQNSPVADSCSITLEGGNMYMSSVSFDDLSFSFPTSTTELEHDEWNIFPNPCRDIFNITGVNSKGKVITVVISDAAGKILWKEKWLAYLDRHVVDTRSLPAGIYMVRITDGETSHHHYIIKN